MKSVISATLFSRILVPFLICNKTKYWDTRIGIYRSVIGQGPNDKVSNNQQVNTLDTTKSIAYIIKNEVIRICFCVN